MPLLRLETNIARSKIPANFIKVTTALVAKMLEKPEAVCAVSVVPDSMISKGGTSDPCGFATFISVGRFNAVENKKYSQIVFDHIEKQLGISKSRLTIHFIDEKAHNIGYEGTTLEEIMNRS